MYENKHLFTYIKDTYSKRWPQPVRKNVRDSKFWLTKQKIYCMYSWCRFFQFRNKDDFRVNQNQENILDPMKQSEINTNNNIKKLWFRRKNLERTIFLLVFTYLINMQRCHNHLLLYSWVVTFYISSLVLLNKFPFECNPFQMLYLEANHHPAIIKKYAENHTSDEHSSQSENMFIRWKAQKKVFLLR